MVQAFTERSIGQWALSSALAYAERAGVLICAALFFLSDSRDFWTFWGLIFVVVHLVILSPVYGILVYLSERLAYRAHRWAGRPVTGMGQLRRLGRIVQAVWLPLMWWCSWVIFNIFDNIAPHSGSVDFWKAAFT